MTLTEIFQQIEDHCAIDIRFFDKLTEQGTPQNPKGVSLVFYDILPWEGAQTLAISTENFGAQFCEFVYWLPWQQCSVESVTWEELDNSGCAVILTSEFTGCRLTITDRGIAHTSFHQGAGCDSFARDFAEWSDFVACGTAVVRRSIGDGGEHYGVAGLNSQMLAVGYKTMGNKWVIKEISYSLGQRMSRRMRRKSYLYGG